MPNEIDKSLEPAPEGQCEAADFAAALAEFCRRVSSTVRPEAVDQTLVDAIQRAFPFDLVAYLGVSTQREGMSFYAARGCPTLTEASFPLGKVLQTLPTAGGQRLMSCSARTLLGASELDNIFAPGGPSGLSQGFLLSLPMLAEGALHVLLVGNRWVQSNVDDTIEFLDAMLGVASLATNSAVSATRFKSEHERVFKAKQEWQCSVDVLDQLICLVDRGGQVMRANKAVETLGLGGVADVRGNYIWELLALLDKQGGEDRGHSLANWCSQIRDDWLTHWQNAADHDGVEWLIQSPTLDPLYCIHMNLVNLGTSTSDGVEAHAVIVVDDMSNSLDWRTKPIRFSTATAGEHIGQGDGPNLIRRDNEESSGELLDAQERERTRIALELHDGIGQMMTMMKLQCDCILQELDDTHLPSGHVKRLGDLRESMAGAIEEVRRIGINLRPPMLDDLGIGPTLRWFFNECAKSDPGFKISAQIDIDENLLSSELETDIFRITQEATNNVVKHARASNLQYSLQTQGDQVKLAIIDDGDGFAAGQSKLDGAGIRNLIKRVAMRGGQLDLVAVPGKGVELRACWKI